jgi:hypothetical protein
MNVDAVRGLINSFRERATAARAHARKLDPKKHYAVVGGYNMEADIYARCARELEEVLSDGT